MLVSRLPSNHRSHGASIRPFTERLRDNYVLGRSCISRGAGAEWPGDLLRHTPLGLRLAVLQMPAGSECVLYADDTTRTLDQTHRSNDKMEIPIKMNPDWTSPCGRVRLICGDEIPSLCFDDYCVGCGELKTCLGKPASSLICCDACWRKIPTWMRKQFLEDDSRPEPGAGPTLWEQRSAIMLRWFRESQGPLPLEPSRAPASRS